MNPLQYFIDLYRTDDTILIHYGIRRVTRSASFWILFGFLMSVCLVLVMLNIWVWFLATLYLGGTLLYLTRSGLQENMIRINRDSIVIDAKSIFGRNTSKRHDRAEDFDVFPSRERIQKQKGRFHNLLKITNAGKEFWARTASLQEASWMVEEIKSFLDQPSGENDVATIPIKTETKIFHGVPFRRIFSPAERADAENGPLEQGVLKIRCGFCQHIVPDEFVFAETARCACPNCQTFFEVPSLKWEPLSNWRRFRFKHEGDRLEVRERLFGWAPSLWTACLLISAYLGFIILGIFALILNAKMMLTPEQFDELWTGQAESGFPFEVSYFALFWGAVVVAILSFLLVFGIFLNRRRILITPTECILTRYFFFFPIRTKISRLDVRQFFIPPERIFGGLYYRTNLFAFPAAQKMRGVVNHFLLDHPPAERKPFDPADETIRWATLGNDENDCVKFKFHDPQTGTVLPFEDALRLLKADTPGNSHLIFYPSASLLGVGFTRALLIEINEQELRFGVTAVSDKKERTEKVVETCIPGIVLFGIYGIALLFGGIVMMADGKGCGVLIAALFAIGIIAMVSIVAFRQGQANLEAGWMLSLTKNRLELKREFRGWEDFRSVQRSEILFAEITSKPTKENFTEKVPGLLQNGSVAIRLRNGESLGVPRIQEFQSKIATQALVNELNEFLNTN